MKTRFLKPGEGGREGQQCSLGPDLRKTLLRWLNKEEDVTHQMQPSQLLRALAQPSQPGPSSAAQNRSWEDSFREALLKLHQMLSGWYCGHVLPRPFLGAMSTLKQEHAVSLALCSVLPTDGPWAARTAPERMAQLTHCKLLRAQPQG